MNPHELLAEFLGYHLGNRMALFGPFLDDLFLPLAQAVADELSIYLDINPYARFKIGEIRIREGAQRAYLFVEVKDRQGPLKMRGTMEHWEQPITSNDPAVWVSQINGRRWHFVEGNLGRVMEPLLRGVADSLVTYYARRIRAVPKAGLLRWTEGIDQTFLVVEIDDRSMQSPKDSLSRYNFQ